ncbi:PREDICTED: serpin B3 [Chrysochloris asiatica]|uniref:Serpin B3 n=1 Tax=Chrysochloris asiatica TaxID=185453 RepID=A0A9B0T4S2_CHRAS|nr:PREDICTED: serpin B3 [Chrysochloris asiatica]
MDSLSEANTCFGIDLYQQMRTSKDGNIFFSPLSISSALSMVYLGGKNNTALQMEKVLHFDDVTGNSEAGATKEQVAKADNVHPQFQKLLTELNNPTDAYEMNIANRLYAEESYQFLQEYLNGTKKFYLSCAESVDFVNAAEKNRKKINDWVAQQTHEKIKELLPEGSLTESTILVLVNAIYFKGQWDQEFNQDNTTEEKFWLNKETSKSVQMMKQSKSFNLVFLEDEQAKVLEIPYKGKDLSMFILLPNEVDGLKKIEDTLTAEKLLTWMSPSSMVKSHVDLYLPRFKVEDKYGLNDMLKALGMVDAFSPQDADFSGMMGSQGLMISKVLHEAFVDVNEEGTEAAAATGIEIVPTSFPIYQEFHCDHPFLFFIKHKETNSILFFGRICSP